jgi:hypothetical protein
MRCPGCVLARQTLRLGHAVRPRCDFPTTRGYRNRCIKPPKTASATNINAPNIRDGPRRP